MVKKRKPPLSMTIGAGMIPEMREEIKRCNLVIDKQEVEIKRLLDVLDRLKRPDQEDQERHLKIMDLLKEQLLVVFLIRLGSKLTISSSEIDGVVDSTFSYGLSKDGKAFTFEVIEKGKTSN